MERVTDLFLGVLDFWELKGGERINPELADIIEIHIGLAYAQGAEGVINYLMKILNREHKKRHPNNHVYGQISISHLKNIINSYEINTKDT